MKPLSYQCPECRSQLENVQMPPQHCASCNTRFKQIDGIPSLLPKKFDDEWRDEFEISAEDGDFSAKTVGYLSDRHHNTMKRAFHHLLLDHPQNQLMIDVGCGHGELTESWTRENRVIGVDFAVNMLKLARQKKLEVYHSDATALPFQDNQFDIALCAEVIQLFDNVTLLLKEMVRIVKPGGSIIISTLNDESVLRRLNRFIKKFIYKDLSKLRLPKLHSLDDFLTQHELPIELIEILLVYSPLTIIRKVDNPHPINLKLASNYVVQYKKI